MDNYYGYYPYNYDPQYGPHHFRPPNKSPIKRPPRPPGPPSPNPPKNYGSYW